MTIAQMKAAARNEIELHGQIDCTPVVNASVDELLEKHKMATIYAASTAYVYGDVVQLSSRNGHRYMCVEAGTSDDTAPTWPTASYAEVTDGTVTWQEYGPDAENVYNTRAILAEIYLKKAEAVSALVTNSSGNRKIEASNLQAQFLQMARAYAPLVIG